MYRFKAQDNLSYLEVQTIWRKTKLDRLSSANTYQKACTHHGQTQQLDIEVLVFGVNRGKTPILIENVTIERVTFNKMHLPPSSKYSFGH